MTAEPTPPPTPEPDGPADPFSVMAVGASSMHELYKSFIDAGFSADQAFAFLLESWRATLARGMMG